MTDRYLRNRPFLTVQLIQRPAKSAKTSVKGWGATDSNWQVLENPVVVDRINDKQMAESNIIIDLLNKKVIKNSFSTNTDEAVLAHYMSKYSQQIAETIQEWNNAHPKAAEPSVVTFSKV